MRNNGPKTLCALVTVWEGKALYLLSFLQRPDMNVSFVRRSAKLLCVAVQMPMAAEVPQLDYSSRGIQTNHKASLRGWESLVSTSVPHLQRRSSCSSLSHWQRCWISLTHNRLDWGSKTYNCDLLINVCSAETLHWAADDSICMILSGRTVQEWKCCVLQAK